MINEQTRNIEVVKQPPGARAVIGRVDLPIQGAEIKTGWIFGINHQGAHVASRRSACTPIFRIMARFGCWLVSARGTRALQPQRKSNNKKEQTYKCEKSTKVHEVNLSRQYFVVSIRALPPISLTQAFAARIQHLPGCSCGAGICSQTGRRILASKMRAFHLTVALRICH